MTRYSMRRFILTVGAIVAVFAAVGLWVRADRAAAATSATLTVAAPGTQPLNAAFSVPVSLSNVTFDAGSPTWNGYDFALDYDPNVVQASAVVPSLCVNPQSSWAMTSLTPVVATSCAFQSNTTTSGTLEMVTFTCVGNGVSALHLAPRLGSAGNALFDQNGIDFAMTLNDASVTCGTGINDPTKTPTPSPTITPTPVFSATATPTATATPPPSATLMLVAPATVVVGDTFQFTSNVSNLMLQGQPGWNGYELVIDYNGGVVRIDGATPRMCVNGWFAFPFTSTIHTSCVGDVGTGVGVLETYTATCMAPGTSALHFEPSNYGAATFGFYDAGGHPFVMTFGDAAVDCVPGVPGPSPTPTATNTPLPLGTGPAAATLTLGAPASPQPLQTSFTLASSLSSLSLDVQFPTWAGYGMVIRYDPSVLEIDAFAPVVCPPGAWGHQPVKPGFLSTDCAFQEFTQTGVLEAYTARCVGDGVSNLHLQTFAEGALLGEDGSEVFNDGGTEFPLTLQDATVTCDHNVDTDGDGCASSREAAFGLDPNNRWDFYSVPVPALFVAPNPLVDLRDSIVSAGDPQAIFAYFRAGAQTGDTLYDQDLNKNGIPDGIEYDRTIIGPAKSGPPDGVITATEAQTAFAQFKRGYAC